VIEQEEAGDGAQHCSGPIRAIHGDIDPTTIFGVDPTIWRVNGIKGENVAGVFDGPLSIGKL
jgi:hypothetical protein